MTRISKIESRPLHIAVRMLIGLAVVVVVYVIVLWMIIVGTAASPGGN